MSLNDAFLSQAASIRGSGKLNLFVLISAFLACIYSINNYNQCTPGNNNYKSGFTKFSYISSILLLTFFCLLFAYDIFMLVKK